VVYWCNSYTIVHFSLDIIEWFKYKLKKVFKLYLILIHPPLSINTSLRPHCSSLSTVGHPQAGTKLYLGKGIPNEANYVRKQELIHHRCQLKLTTYSPLFPTCLSHPKKCAPSLLNSPSSAPLPFRASTTC
jgi:hypothetical protein